MGVCPQYSPDINDQDFPQSMDHLHDVAVFFLYEFKLLAPHISPTICTSDILSNGDEFSRNSPDDCNEKALD